MEKRKITAREVLKDVRAGMNDTALMKKYMLSAQGLQSVFNKMIEARMVDAEELDARVPLSERTVDIGLFICPACGNIQGREFTVCPRCNYTAPGQARKTTTTKISPQKSKAQPTGMSSAQNSRSSLGGGSVVSSRVVEQDRGGSVVSSRVVESDSGGSVVSSGVVEPADGGQAPAKIKPDLGKIIRYCRILGIVALPAYIVVGVALLIIIQISANQGLLTAAQSVLGVLILGLPTIMTGFAVFLILRALAASMTILQEISNQAQE